MLGGRRGYPGLKTLVAGHHSRILSRAALRGGPFFSEHFDPEIVTQALRVELLGNDPFACVGDDIGELQEA